MPGHKIQWLVDLLKGVEGHIDEKLVLGGAMRHIDKHHITHIL